MSEFSLGWDWGILRKKTTFELLDAVGAKLVFPAEFGNTFGICNVTLQHYFGERGFWYGGVGAGIACVSMTADPISLNPPNPDGGFGIDVKAWIFLRQGFTDFGLCLNDNWSLIFGYLLRYLSGNTTWLLSEGAGGTKFKMKQDLIHAAEVGRYGGFRKILLEICL